jgi:tRNA(Ile)-lysidine synthetase-like protein
MRYILAVSGGVDSVVLLDMVARRTKDGFIVAHFDHGIRSESGKDADFVRRLAKKYKARFELGEGKLGRGASEEEAREARYQFLKKLQKKYQPAKIVTAHHQDDLVETIVMNLIRGTGWRGLAPMNAELERPLLGLSKTELVEYAISNHLKWAEDQTNYSPKYFRNRIRTFLLKMTPEQRKNLLLLNAKQQMLRRQIEDALADMRKAEVVRQEFLLALPRLVTLEVLRELTRQKLTIPQLKLLMKNLCVAKSGDLLHPGGKVQVGIYQGQVTVTELTRQTL